MLGKLIRGNKKDIIPTAKKVVLTAAGVLVAIYGMKVFIQRTLFDYMFLRTQFVFLDFNESKLWFYLDYLAMMGAFICIAHYGVKICRLRGKGKARIKM